jgi:hypothetical protein
MQNDHVHVAIRPRQYSLRSLFGFTTAIPILCALFVPLPSTVTPKIVVTVVDASGRPVGAIALHRSWSGNWDYQSDELWQINQNGVCELPARTVAHSAVSRISILLMSLLPHQGGWGEAITDISIEFDATWDFERVAATGPETERTYSWLDRPGRMTFRLYGTNGERSCQVVLRRPSSR